MYGRPWEWRRIDFNCDLLVVLSFSILYPLRSLSLSVLWISIPMWCIMRTLRVCLPRYKPNVLSGIDALTQSLYRMFAGSLLQLAALWSSRQTVVATWSISNILKLNLHRWAARLCEVAASPWQAHLVSFCLIISMLWTLPLAGCVFRPVLCHRL